jgi:hypothetical protein
VEKQISGRRFSIQVFTALCELLAHYGPHGSADKGKFESGNHHFHRIHSALHHDQRIALACGLLRCNQSVLVLLQITELENVHGLHVGIELDLTRRIQKEFQAATGRNPQVMITLGTHFQIALQVGPVQDCLATRALLPQTFGDTRTLLACDTRGAACAANRGKDFVDPTHK